MLSVVLKKSTPGKFSYMCHFQPIRINVTAFEKTGIHFKADVFAAAAVVDVKAPYCFRGGAARRVGIQVNLMSDFPSRFRRQKKFPGHKNSLHTISWLRYICIHVVTTSDQCSR